MNKGVMFLLCFLLGCSKPKPQRHIPIKCSYFIECKTCNDNISYMMWLDGCISGIQNEHPKFHPFAINEYCTKVYLLK